MKSKKIIIVMCILNLIKVQINGYEQEKVKSTCGRRLVNHNALITYGLSSKEGDWPWHAAIFHYTNSDKAYRCGGTVINANSILTAAHCVYENNQLIIPERILVELGKYNLKLSGPNTQEFEVYRVVAHPDFTTSELRNDIAIIRLSTEATFSDYVQPICLWQPNKVALSVVTEQLGTVIGWGLTENDQISHTLRQTAMPVVSHLICLDSNRDVFGKFLANNNFCAGFKNGTSACNGDSGGSMTFEENGVYRIRGIVSLTVAKPQSGVCNSEEYVLFTDVAKYLNWIEEEVPQLGNPTKFLKEANLYYVLLPLNVLVSLKSSALASAQLPQYMNRTYADTSDHGVVRWIESPRLTNWGVWYEEELCPQNSWVSAMNLKIEPYLGRRDDSALNGIKLSCTTLDGLDTAEITSGEGPWGFYRGDKFCKSGFATGFQLRSEPDLQSRDDAAAIDLKLFCFNTDGTASNIIVGDVLPFGDFTQEQFCPAMTAICGIRTQIQDYQGSGDDTALNNVDFACCPYSVDISDNVRAPEADAFSE